MNSDNQKVFNIVVKHLLTQNAVSLSAEGSCRYRGENGLKCAIGCLIDDKYYESCFENRSAAAFCILNAIYESYNLSPDAELLCVLQKIHDFNDPRQWRDMLKEVATEQNLIFPSDI